MWSRRRRQRAKASGGVVGYYGTGCPFIFPRRGLAEYISCDPAACVLHSHPVARSRRTGSVGSGRGHAPTGVNLLYTRSSSLAALRAGFMCLFGSRAMTVYITQACGFRRVGRARGSTLAARTTPECGAVCPVVISAQGQGRYGVRKQARERPVIGSKAGPGGLSRRYRLGLGGLSACDGA